VASHLAPPTQAIEFAVTLREMQQVNEAGLPLDRRAVFADCWSLPMMGLDVLIFGQNPGADRPTPSRSSAGTNPTSSGSALAILVGPVLQRCGPDTPTSHTPALSVPTSRLEGGASRPRSADEGNARPVRDPTRC